jgi:DNA uptake protein ComE-like DNA-binding protein
MEETEMKIQNRFGRVLCGAALALAFSVVPATWAAPKSGSSHAAATQSKTAPVDINTATVDQLKAVPGIGDAYAKRIIASRPYTSKDQLVSKGVLPQGVYDKVKGSLVAHHGKK